jgi:excisionase family DNA binding protein
MITGEISLMGDREEMLTTEESAARLHVSPVTVRSYIRRKLLTAIKRGRDNFISSSELDTFQETHSTRPGKRPRKEK